MAGSPGFGDLFSQCRCNPFRPDMPDGGQTFERQMVEPVQRFDGQDFTGNRTACDHVNLF